VFEVGFFCVLDKSASLLRGYADALICVSQDQVKRLLYDIYFSSYQQAKRNFLWFVLVIFYKLNILIWGSWGKIRVKLQQFPKQIENTGTLSVGEVKLIFTEL